MLTPLQTKVYRLLKNKKYMTVIEIAKIVFNDVPDKHKPKCINNSITSAIIQMNKKYKGLVEGMNYGRNGKVVWLNTSDRIKVTLDQHVCKG